MFSLSTGLKGAHFLPRPKDMPYLDQGTSNGCGTTSLAMVMTYLGVAKTKDEIDHSIRRMDVFSSPEDLINYARKNGLDAEGYNKGSWEDVKTQVELGHPCICMIEADYSYPAPVQGTLNGLHYVAINGYGEDPATKSPVANFPNVSVGLQTAAKDTFSIFHDPNVGEDSANGTPGIDMEAPIANFEEIWDKVGWGFHKYYMAFGPKGSRLPSGNNDGVEGVFGTLDGVANLVNGLNRLYNPDNFGDWFHGLFQFVGGIVQTIVSGVGGLLQLAGQKLNEAVDNIPVVKNIVQPIGDLLNGVGAILGDIGNGIGNVVDDVGGAFGDLFSGDVGGFVEGVGDAIGDAASAVGDALGDAASAVGDAISDVFSGW